MTTPQTAPVTPIDVTVENQGSMFVFQVHTEAARAWVDENVGLESWQWLGGSAFAVDARFAENLASGMQNDGLEVR